VDALEPIVLSIDLPVAPTTAFELFASSFTAWWPAATHSLSRDSATTCHLECVQGGAVEEQSPSGARHRWGTVEALEPGHRLRFTWHPGREPDCAQWVEVTFEPLGGGSRVTLTHGGWEALGEIAPILRREYASGWQIVLGECFARFAQGAH
jgi:uncharacterized protein YndB with AHSA1/START domain